MGPPGVLLSSTNDMIVTPTRSTTLCSTRRSRYSVTRFLNPAHEFFCSRKLRLAPQDYSPWTPPLDRFLLRSYTPPSLHPRVLGLVRLYRGSARSSRSMPCWARRRRPRTCSRPPPHLPTRHKLRT